MHNLEALWYCGESTELGIWIQISSSDSGPDYLISSEMASVSPHFFICKRVPL